MAAQKKDKNKSYAYRFIFITGIFALASILVGGVCFQYYNRLQTTMREESGGYLEEVSKRIGDNINRIIKDNYAVLDTIASVLVSQDVNSFDDIKMVVETQQEYWSYDEIMLIDSKGIAYNSEGKEIRLYNDLYLQDAVINRNQSLSTSQLVGNQERVVFAIPVENLEIGGKSMTALASSYDPLVFDQVLSMTAFDGIAASHIISKDGSVIIRSSVKDSMKMGYNVLSTLESAAFTSGKKLPDVKADMQADLTGQIEFTYDGAENYLVYTPIQPEDWYLMTIVPASVVNERSDMLLTITMRLCGFITLIFAALLAFIIYNFYRNKKKLESIAYIDEVTGGYTIQKFYQLAEEVLEVPGHAKYALIFTNIEKFKILNEQFGRALCDRMLAAFHDCVSENLTDHEYVGRIAADNFCILVRYEDDETLIKRFKRWYENEARFVSLEEPGWALPMTEFGALVIDDDRMPFPLMIDRAKMALSRSTCVLDGRIRYAFYNEELGRKLFREKQLEDMMEKSLEQREFQVYLQPKYRVNDEKIGGAEALSRWINASEGMIYPDEFIPLFEKNGFIINLDLWVFEEVCRMIRRWLDNGKTPVRISVNCSRIHLRDPRFLDPYIKLAAKYDVPREYLEIELTESVVMENAEMLGKTIDQIHEAGFACSMDDFGSGYSSLNLIQSIPVDTLKLDKIFFKNKDEAKAESVVGGMITMAKALSMETVAEGVEYREQVDMLKKVGCNYIQGYVFEKPVPVLTFEKLLFKENNYND